MLNMAPNLRGILPLAMIRLWSRLHGDQLYRGFSPQTPKEKKVKRPAGHDNDFQSLNMAPERMGLNPWSHVLDC
jgi:hypothetical protein